MNDPVGCTALVLYAGDAADGSLADAEAGGDAAIPAGSSGGSSGGDRRGGQPSCTASACPPQQDNPSHQQASAAPRRFVGLSNQGATCYMNSLLQTLYMTPEFRAALYAWKHEPNAEGIGVEGGDGGGGTDTAEDPSDCIPLQLQRLFGQLQMSDRTCIETRALTDSFGWTAQDSFQQHDVQELCRVLFDALESTFQETVNERLVNDLYQGSLRDYVTCKECHAESSRLDNFLDISLVLRPFGSDKTMKSVTESLEYFLKPEVLDRDNQYCCQACAKKVDAVKGLKFERLPYLLSLQLKRFDFDYNTLQRIKLNDEMRFPMVLDMNKYVDNPGGGEGGEGEGTSGVGGRAKHRSDFQRSLSLEKRKLQGLLGLAEENEATSADMEIQREGESASRDQEGAEKQEEGHIRGDARGLEGVEGLTSDAGGLGSGVGEQGTEAKGSGGATDPDTDETDKEEGSMDSGGSMEAKLDMADLPGLEDYWGTSFEDAAGGSGSSSGNSSYGRSEGQGGGGSVGIGVIGSEKRTDGWTSGDSSALRGDGVHEGDSSVPEEREEDPLQLLRENGPWVYELFAVLIHSGSALGGHYYAHIKSLGDDAGWFTFNDSRVTPTTEEAVKQAWGGRWSQTSSWQRRGATSSASGNGGSSFQSAQQSSSPAPPVVAPKWGSSAANAYMLMYRRVDPLMNKRHLHRDEVPEHVRNQVSEEDRKAKEAAAEAAAAAAARQSSIKIRVLLNGGKYETTISGDKRRPVSELADAAAEAFGIAREGLIPVAETAEGVVGAGTQRWAKDASDEEDSAGGETDRETQDEGRSDCGGSGTDTVGGGADAEADTAPGHGKDSDSVVFTESTDSQPRVIPQRLIRLREYLMTPKLPGAPFDDIDTVGDLSFFQNKTVWLETREPGAPWARFNANDVNVAVVRFYRTDEGEAGNRTGGNTTMSGSGGITERLNGCGEGAPKSITPVPDPLLVLGKFAPERNTRLKASGTVGEIRATLAAFAGTTEARTRVFTMATENAESSYEVLCPPARCVKKAKTDGRELPSSLADGEREGTDGEAIPGIITEVSSACVVSAREVAIARVAALRGLSKGADAPGSNVGLDTVECGPCGNNRGNRDGEEEEDVGEDGIVVLGEPGSTSLHKIFVEEVPEDEEDHNQSLAVRVATDEANRITIKLTLHDNMKGPETMTADKRWSSDQLRDILAALLGRDNRSFRIHKGQNNSPEVRPGRETLRSLNFYTQISLHLSVGRPLERDEEALTIVPLDVGFSAGLGPPPASVVEAIARGKKKKTKKDGNAQCAVVRGIEGTALPLADGAVSKNNVDGEGDGAVADSDDKDSRNSNRVAIARESGTDSSVSQLSDAAEGRGKEDLVTAPGADSDAHRGVNEASIPQSPPLESNSSGDPHCTAGDHHGHKEPPDALPTASAAEEYSKPVLAAATSADDTKSSVIRGPIPRAADVFAEAAAAAAANAERSSVETAILTSTVVEVGPEESCWGEKFTLAVKLNSTVMEVRKAVWEEMRKRGLVGSSTRNFYVDPETVDASSSGLQGQSQGNGGSTRTVRQDQSRAMGRTPGALRLREKLGPRPARIIRNSDGKLARFHSRQTAGTRPLVAQALISEETLGSCTTSSGCGGESSKQGSAALASDASGEDGAVPKCDGECAGGAPPADAIVIVVQWWDRMSWRLTVKYEAWVSPEETTTSVRNRLAKQVGVDPANLRAHRCAYRGRLRLCDLGGYGGSSGDVGLVAKAGGWGSGSPSLCPWEDLDASHGNRLMGSDYFSDGDLLLLQDVSQPIKELTAATKASMGTVDARTSGAGSGSAWSSSPRREGSTDGDTCDMNSIGSWYAGSSTTPSGTVDDSGVQTKSLLLTPNPWTSATSSSAPTAGTSSSVSSSFKPKERALRIRTRRDRLQEGKTSAAAAAAAATIATAAAAVVAASSTATNAADGPTAPGNVCSAVGGRQTSRKGEFEGERGDSEPNHRPRVCVGTAFAKEAGVGDVGSLETESTGSLSDVTIVGGTGVEALSSGENTVDAAAGCGTQASGEHARSIGPGAPSAGDDPEVRGIEEGGYEDLWGVPEERSCVDSRDGGGGGMLMHSDAEVAERGGLSQFEDLA